MLKSDLLELILTTSGTYARKCKPPHEMPKETHINRIRRIFVRFRDETCLPRQSRDAFKETHTNRIRRVLHDFATKRAYQNNSKMRPKQNHCNCTHTSGNPRRYGHYKNTVLKRAKNYCGPEGANTNHG